MVTKKLDYLKNRNKARYERKRKAEPFYEKPCSIGFFLYEDKDFIFMQTSTLDLNRNEVWAIDSLNHIRLGLTRDSESSVSYSYLKLSRSGLGYSIIKKKWNSLGLKSSQHRHTLLRGLYWIKRFNTGEFK